MNFLVYVKQVPDTSQVKMDPVTKRLNRSNVDNILNPFDEHALEAALSLRDTHGGKVTVVTMGPPQAEKVLRECIAMGADEAYLVSDRKFGGADTLATSYTLAMATRKIGDFDMFFCGKQAIDGDTAQVGPQIAENLNLPQGTCVISLSVEKGLASVTREHEDGYETLEIALPLLITLSKSANKPRRASIRGKMQARKAQIVTLSAEDIGVDSERIGLAGSPTRVRNVFTPDIKMQGQIITGLTAQESAQRLLHELQLAKIIGG